MKLFDKVDKTFLINLKKRKDRLDHFIQQVNVHDLGNFEIFEAIDGSLMIENNLRLNKGELGLVHSTIKILEESLDKKYKKILIIEDDCLFNENINEIDTYLDKLPNDWDFVYFGGNHNIHVNSPYPKIVNDKIVKVHNTFATHCIMIHERIIEILINELKKFEYPVDIVYQKLQDKYNFYCFNPLVATQMIGFSDIQNTNVNYTRIIN